MKDVRFMVDIETNGIDRDNMVVLEVGVLPVLYRDRYWRPFESWDKPEGTEPFQYLLHSSLTPQTDFAKKNQSELYKLCNEETTLHTVEDCRMALLNWFNGFDIAPSKRILVGKNVTGFDIPILEQAGILTKDDYNYRVQEQTGSIETVTKALNLRDRNTTYQAALALSPTSMPDAVLKLGSHRALYDCYEQVNLENGLMSLVRRLK